MSFFRALLRYAGDWLYSAIETAVATVAAMFRRKPAQDCVHPDAGEDGP